MSSYLDSLMSTGETIQLATRQHWIRLLRTVVLNGLAIVVALALGGWTSWSSLGAGDASGAGGTGGVGGFMDSARPFLLLVLGIVILWALANLLLAYSRWRAKQYAVTTRRVIEVDGLFNKTVIDSNLDKVNDVVLRQSALGRVLGYGDIEIITGADIGLNRLECIHDPLTFKRLMLDNKEDFDSLARARVDAPGTIAPADIPAAIERLGALLAQGLITPEEFERKKAELLSRY